MITHQLKDIIEVIGQRLENEDPILYEHIKKLVERQFFLLYPFKLEPDDVHLGGCLSFVRK